MNVQQYVPGSMYDEYWRFAAQRQAVYERRLEGQPPPWTDNPVLSNWRFTNAYRAADRVSQYLIRNVIYSGSQRTVDVLFRILLFKWFNRVDTWEHLVNELGEPTPASFDAAAAIRLLNQRREHGGRVYSAAYIVPPVPGFDGPKHVGHIALSMRMVRSGLADALSRAGSFAEVFGMLRAWPGVGDFLAYQLAIDINYSTIIDFDENDFVAPGPGALDGISKVWPGAKRRDAADLIKRTCADQEHQFARLGLTFGGLFGRPLKLIDCQNLYCEISKYTREAHPSVVGIAGRSRIKQAYAPDAGGRRPLAEPFFPPKWGLSLPAPRLSGGAWTTDQMLFDVDGSGAELVDA